MKLPVQEMQRQYRKRVLYLKVSRFSEGYVPNDLSPFKSLDRVLGLAKKRRSWKNTACPHEFKNFWESNIWHRKPRSSFTYSDEPDPGWENNVRLYEDEMNFGEDA